MRGIVYNNGVAAGILEKEPGNTYLFRYNDDYFNNDGYRPISLTLPKTQQEHRSEKLFAFFFGLLSEGINKEIQCRLLKIDEEDDFMRLLLTTGDDTIGAITVKPEIDEMPGLLH